VWTILESLLSTCRKISEKSLLGKNVNVMEALCQLETRLKRFIRKSCILNDKFSDKRKDVYSHFFNSIADASGDMATLDTRDPTASVYLKQGLYLKDVITQPQSVFDDGMRVAKCPRDHQYYHPNTEKCYTSPPTIFAFNSK
jgi:hypothetical protein